MDTKVLGSLDWAYEQIFRLISLTCGRRIYSSSSETYEIGWLYEVHAFTTYML